MPLPSPIRVLLAIPKMESGGSQRVMLNLLRNLDRSRFELHLALLDTEGPHFKDIPQDVSIHHLGVSSARFAVLPFAKLCRRIRPRAVLSMLAYMNAAVIAARPLLPKPIRLLIREGTRTASSQVTRNALRLWGYKQAYRRADVVVCQSEFMKQEMRREFGLAPKHWPEFIIPWTSASFQNWRARARIRFQRRVQISLPSGVSRVKRASTYCFKPCGLFRLLFPAHS